MHDTEIVSSSATAGTLDLDAEPSWGNDSGSGSFGTASEGDSGTETVELSVSDNPSYVWFRTGCARCTPVEDALFVRFGIDTDRDGTVDRWLDNDYQSLRTARERFGEGTNLGEIDESDTWEFVVEWELRDGVAEDTNVDFDFGFYATQSRHVSNTDAIAPDWECGGTCNDDRPSVSAISWVAFCSSQTLSEDDFEFSRSDDGRTLVFERLPDTVDTLLIKYGTSLDVFEDPRRTTITAGSGATFTQVTNEFPGTDPLRSNSVPCPNSNGCTYEFPDEDGAGGWDCGSTSGDRPREKNDDSNGGSGRRDGGAGNDRRVSPRSLRGADVSAGGEN
jgi:hypothetical protein